MLLRVLALLFLEQIFLSVSWVHVVDLVKLNSLMDSLRDIDTAVQKKVEQGCGEVLLEIEFCVVHERGIQHLANALAHS